LVVVVLRRMSGVEQLIYQFKNCYHTSLSLTARTATGENVRLRPLQATAEYVRPEDVELLTEWRNRNRQYFMSDFTATIERTLHWLTQIAGPDLTRILFMLEASNHSFGHVGLCNIEEERSYCEIDNVVRGCGGPRGAMSATVATLCRWARERLGLSDIWVRVMADNPSVAFYSRLGFRSVRDVPLERRIEGDLVRWVEIGGDQRGTERTHQLAQRYLKYMRLWA